MSQNFLQKHLEKFTSGANMLKKREKLLKCGSDMTQMAQHIIQCSCEVAMSIYESKTKNLMSKPSRTGDNSSLKINDYQSSYGRASPALVNCKSN